MAKKKPTDSKPAEEAFEIRVTKDFKHYKRGTRLKLTPADLKQIGLPAANYERINN